MEAESVKMSGARSNLHRVHVKLAISRRIFADLSVPSAQLRLCGAADVMRYNPHLQTPFVLLSPRTIGWAEKQRVEKKYDRNSNMIGQMHHRAARVRVRVPCRKPSPTCSKDLANLTVSRKPVDILPFLFDDMPMIVGPFAPLGSHIFDEKRPC